MWDIVKLSTGLIVGIERHVLYPAIWRERRCTTWDALGGVHWTFVPRAGRSERRCLACPRPPGPWECWKDMLTSPWEPPRPFSRRRWHLRCCGAAPAPDLAPAVVRGYGGSCPSDGRSTVANRGRRVARSLLGR